MNRIRDVWIYRDMIFSLVKRDLRGRYKGSILGFLWTLLNPMFQLIIYTLVFSFIMKAGIEDYYLFLFVALIPWIFFSSSVHAGAGCIWSQKGMINKIYFPRAVLPIAHVISQLVNMLLSFVVVFAVLLVAGKNINVLAIAILPFLIAIEFLLALGMVFLVSSVSVFFPDLMQILGILMMLWQFLTPVMYAVESVPMHMQGYFKANPMTSIIDAYRDILYYAKTPNVNTLLSSLWLSILVLLIGWVIFGVLEKKFSEVL